MKSSFSCFSEFSAQIPHFHHFSDVILEQAASRASGAGGVR
ncbi:hypothetical protein BSIN_1551 [Burkholderia singularis]|uniref:Uncharacterized protein n=1 Tax=Burkholderia singularis TaxID=1503053 RepID=A0A238GZ62_9BURK|nr:hypothetical protein BSIN_1551 [Burkholderia singularis]